jgi:hypothetical protein
MALVNTGALQLGLPASIPANQNISSEFGGAPAPYSLSEYYRGGGLVPNNATPVPTSGEISFSNFYGTSAYTPVSVNIGNFNQSRGDFLPPYSLTFNLSLTATASGGNGSYNYNWARNAYNKSGDGLLAYINQSPTSGSGNPFAIGGSNNTQAQFGVTVYTGSWSVTAGDGTTNATANFTVDWNAEQAL